MSTKKEIMDSLKEEAIVVGLTIGGYITLKYLLSPPTDDTTDTNAGTTACTKCMWYDGGLKLAEKYVRLGC